MSVSKDRKEESCEKLRLSRAFLEVLVDDDDAPSVEQPQRGDNHAFCGLCGLKGQRSDNLSR